MIARSPTEGARRPYVRRPHSPPVAARSLVPCAPPCDAFVLCCHVRGSPAVSFGIRRPRYLRLGKRRASRQLSLPLSGNAYAGNCLIFQFEVAVQFLVMQHVLSSLCCSRTRFGVCSGVAPVELGIDHPAFSERHLAGHCPLACRCQCALSRARAVLRVSPLRRCVCVRCPFGGIWAFGRVSRRLLACVVSLACSRLCCVASLFFVAWRRSRVRCVAPFSLTPCRVVVLLALDIRGICFGSSLCLVTSFGGFVSGMRLFGWTEVGPMPVGQMPVGPKAVGPLGTSRQNCAGAHDKCSFGFWRRSACADWRRLNILSCSRRFMRRFARAERQIIYGTWPRCVVMFGIPIWLCCSCTNLFC